LKIETGPFQVGLFAAPELKHPGLSLISYVKPLPIEKYLAFKPPSGSKSLLYSQSKLTTLRRENRKIRHKDEILKAKESTPYV
jgi:hypothetical protein